MPNYKRIYFQGYNYVFFTIVTNNRENILIKNFEDTNNINDLNFE